jgi:hypothetical protein
VFADDDNTNTALSTDVATLQGELTTCRSGSSTTTSTTTRQQSYISPYNASTKTILFLTSTFIAVREKEKQVRILTEKLRIAEEIIGNRPTTTTI